MPPFQGLHAHQELPPLLLLNGGQSSASRPTSDRARSQTHDSAHRSHPVLVRLQPVKRRSKDDH